MNDQEKKKFDNLVKKIEGYRNSRLKPESPEVKIYRNAQRFDEMKKILSFDKIEKTLIKHLEKGVNDYFREKHVVNISNNNGKLYLAHYTDIATIHSILTKQQKIKKSINENQKVLNGLRLSSAVYSNDPTEGSYLKNELVKHYEWLDFAKRETDAFFCSFVSSTTDKNIGDKITYWQSYGKDGLGCSIQLSDSFKKDIFHRVLYEKDDIHEVKNKFEAYFKLGKKIYQDYKKYQFSDKYIKDFVTKFWKAFDKIKFLYKHEGYKYENEYRIVKVPKEKKEIKEIKEEFVIQRPHLKRYILDERLSVNEVFISGSKIFIGPRVFNKKYLRDYLAKLYSNASFTISEIPYQKV